MIALPLRALAWVVWALPAPARGLLARFLGWACRTAGLRSQVVRDNLSRAFPKDSPEQRRARERLAYSHLGNLVLEILLVLGPMKRFVLSRGSITGVEHWKAAKARGKGVLFLSSHVGNWEVMAAVGALRAGMDLMLVTKHLKPEWLHGAIERGRLRCGVRATYEPRTLRDVLAALHRNETVGFVLDQYAGPPVGVRVPVFGVPVGTMTALAILAKRTGATVLPVVNHRTADGRFEVEVRAPLDWKPETDPNYEIASNTARYALEMEKDIYAHPDQWLWTHRRFKGDLSPLRPGEWSEPRK